MPSRPHPAFSCLGHALSRGAPTLAFRVPCEDSTHARQCQPRWADQLLSPCRGTSAWTQGTEYSLPSPWDHTALLTHETNTCRLFKKDFNKTAWLAPGCPYPLSPCALPAPPFHYGRFLGRPKSRVSCTLPPGIVQFLGQDFKRAAGCLGVLGIDQPLARHCPGRLRDAGGR